MPNLFALLFLLLYPQTTSKTEQENWEQIRSIAEAQHEIVMLLIKKTQFDKVLEASKKIFSLNFPYDQEHLFVKEGQIVADALIHHKQYELAHDVLDAALKAVISSKSKASLYKEKAYLCTKEGEDDEAMKLFEKALELEKSSP
ncbi:MAG: hypothetical protein ACE5MK_03140 [Acidobacteriota bacterium]